MKRFCAILLLSLVGFSVQAQTVAGYTSLGSKAIQRGEYMLALDYLNKALNISSYNSEAYFLRGYAKFELDDYIGAERDLTEAIRLNPRNHENFLYRGVARSQLFKYQEAFEDFNMALSLNDDDWRVFSNRALASLQLDRFVDVISDCNRVIDLKKQNAQTYLLRGEAKSGLEMHKVAIEDFERAIKMDSTAMQPVLRRGVARTKLERFELALEDYNKAMELDSTNSLPLFYRGVAYADMGRQKDALNDFNAVLQVYPKNEVVLFNRAMLYGDMNRKSDALADYDQVVKLNPKNILARFNRGILHFNSKAYSKSLVDLEAAIKLFPEFLDAHETRLQVLRILGKQSEYQEAERELNEVKAKLVVTDESVKEEQQIKLMKLTELKGDFQQVSQEVGKVQHQEVDIRLLPFYRISPFPETDKDISVYDGYGKPFYGMGIITFTSQAVELTVEQTKKGIFAMNDDGEVTSTELVRSVPLYARLFEFDLIWDELTKRIKADTSEPGLFFARANLKQTQLELIQKAHLQKIGSLDVVDTVYQNQIENLIAQIENDYHRVVELDPNMSFAHYNLAHVLSIAERYEEAEESFGNAANIRGNFIEANYNRGLIRLILGKTQKGCEDLSVAGELGFTDAYNVINRYCD